jgi:hypothetical protein
MLFMTIFHTLPLGTWISEAQPDAASALEEGKILYLPKLRFNLNEEELPFLSDKYSDGKAKNISFNPMTAKIKGTLHKSEILKTILIRYSQSAATLIKTLIPEYTSALQIGKTSLRPVEIQGRKSASPRKDDTRLHVDAFPSNPNQGKRILRVFCNIHPTGKPRIWRIGTPFEQVAKKFLPQVPTQLPFSGKLLKTLKITKSLRTPYDHLMLHIHDKMKQDETYQASVPFTEVAFPAPCTWIVYTDAVSHAALAGQHVLEQTFYLPSHSMLNENKSPLKILERLTGKRLVS